MRYSVLILPLQSHACKLRFTYRRPVSDALLQGMGLLLMHCDQYMPLVTTLTRSNLLKGEFLFSYTDWGIECHGILQCEAYIFLAEIWSLSLKIWFLPVLYAFPPFIESLVCRFLCRHASNFLTAFVHRNSQKIPWLGRQSTMNWTWVRDLLDAVDGGVMWSEDDLTYKLGDIIKPSTNVRRCEQEGVPAHVITEFEQFLQVHHFTYIFSHICIPTAH